jgi:hypothetical protein
MGHPVQAQLARSGKHTAELLGGMPPLRGVQTHSDELFAIGQGVLQRLQGRFFTEMAQKTQNQLGPQVPFSESPVTGAPKSPDDRTHGHATIGVGLWVEEQLCTNDTVACGTLQIGPSHVVEVLLLEQHTGPGVIHVEKALQVGEGISRAQRFHAGVGQGHAIAPCEFEDELGLQRTFNVDVQFGLGCRVNHLQQAMGGNAVEVDGAHGGFVA